MFKCKPSEKGGTLMLVFGFIVLISLIIAPLAMSTSIGLLQAKTNGNSEGAFTEAHSAMTVFARLYEELDAAGVLNTQDQVEKLVAAVDAMNGLNADLTIITNSTNKPVAVTFTADYGNGKFVRDSKLRYNLGEIAPDPTPTPTPKPEETPTPPLIPTSPPITVKEKVILKDSTTNPKKFNKLFAACEYKPYVGEPLPNEYFKNDLKQTEFINLFNPTADSYLNASASAIAKGIKDPRLSQEIDVSHTTTSGDLHVKKSQAVINHLGPVFIGGSTNQNITNPIIIGSDSKGLALTATGNLEFTDIVKNEVKFDGDVKVAGNLRVREIASSGSIVFGGDVFVRGDVELGYNGVVDNIIVNGDLIINGNLKIKNTLQKLIVHGDIIIGGSTNVDKTVKLWEVNGDMVMKGEVFLNNTVYTFKVDGNVMIGDSFTFKNTIEEKFYVGGSLLVKNDLNFNISVNTLKIVEHIIVGGNVTFSNVIKKEFNVGGSFVAQKDITFGNDTMGLIHIGENMITKANLSFNPYGIDGGLQIDGILLVFQDANFQALEKDWKINKIQGFYIGGNTTFYKNYSESWYFDNLASGSQQESICITK